MAKSSTRRVTIYINGKEEDASGWQVFSYGKLGEVTENIPIFAPASRTQIQTNTHTNMRTTHNPSPITRNPAEKHAFSAKERDAETGLSYFGTRYYSSDLSLWLSVDPMADLYPSMSPYTYCANYPVKFVDPNGKDYEVVVDEKAMTITIKATYYTTAYQDQNIVLEQGVNYWLEINKCYEQD